ncbi:peptidoglycan DD-metalloendopeptidase family protein [Oceanisphaera pacifica]|uniref:Peptidoglycan DD-metalloendopeptidase family protein n=1 Tax=Oceanisphaera pacifica TaxID=2818389 RepID=A0ABS3NIF6_9GAMM|nr:peptidoglycan DD-metalloendopeptidase family protein [Oceanisphaera pacifica]MBO1520363.1 peptidoglycan DD-metalloendopeptidase family protein [Oceanisphaera pacifica]
MIHRFKALPRQHKVAISLLSALVGLLFMAPTELALASRSQPAAGLNSGERQPLPLELTDLPTSQAAQLAQQEHVVTIKKGDTLSAIFESNDLPSSLLRDITRLGKAATGLQRIYPSKQITFSFKESGQFAGLRYPIDNQHTLEIEQTPNGLQAKTSSATLESRTAYAQATVTSNFWNAGAKAGLTPNQIMNLAAMFAWDVDFALDIRANDSFTVLYEQHYKNGFKVGTGKILAAEFINQGKRYQAVRHTDGNYYSADGRAMRKSFLRAPVSFTHISSNFNPRRLHPVTGKVRPHRGIDYAARTGTPVLAAGSGTVMKSGYNRFNGNYVFIRHDSTYVTKYLHLNKRLVRQGQKVKQEQKIGTVGATGRVTGPHLHYEFLVNGVHKNPKTVDMPQAAVLSKSELAQFKPKADQLMAQLGKVSGIMVAKN